MSPVGYVCACGEFHSGGTTCPRQPRYRKPSGRDGSTRRWRKTRARVLARDHHRCANCGEIVGLEVHHVNGDHLDNALSNLATLCGSCHDREHARSEAETGGTARRGRGRW